MQVVRCFRVVIVTLACLSWLWPEAGASAGQLPAPSASPPATIQDVRLADGGGLEGQWQDGDGCPAVAQTVALVQGSQVCAQTRTDAAGRFSFPHVRGGLYQVTTGRTYVSCRVWTRHGAPPAAQDQVQLTETTVVRGQQPISALFTNPLVIGLIVAAAIAIPLAVAHKEQPSGS